MGDYDGDGGGKLGAFAMWILLSLCKIHGL